MNRFSYRQFVVRFISSIVLAIFAFAVVWFLFPQFLSALALPPKLLEIQPSPIFTSQAREGDVVMATFTVKNLAPRPISILGAKSLCSCTVAEGLPLKLEPSESGHIRLRVKVGQFDKQGLFSRSATLFTNGEGTIPPLEVQVSRAESRDSQ